jgi:hypothetical protein
MIKPDLGVQQTHLCCYGLQSAKHCHAQIKFLEVGKTVVFKMTT